ncbi:hypothetical protein COCMIDRAFT_78577, partial [Bipolaris oryzae ATCC 44560]
TLDTALRMLQSRLTTPLSNAKQPAAIRLLRELSHLPLPCPTTSRTPPPRAHHHLAHAR